MEVLMEVLQTFFMIVLTPIYVLLAPVLYAFGDSYVGGAIICLIASVAYIILCFLATIPGWKYEDTIVHCHPSRVWSLGGGWRFLHVVLKFLLTALHVAIYWAIWHGEAFGLSKDPHAMADICCAVATIAGLILSAWMVYSSNEHEAKHGPSRYSC